MSKEMTLRDYQQRGVDDIRQIFLKGKWAPLYVLPTGGGKTIVFSYIAKNTSARAKRVLILVHRIELMRQTSAKLYESSVDHGLINPKFTPNITASVQVASVQTLVRRLEKARFDYDLVIVDEAHHAVAGTWNKILNKVKEKNPNARILGVTATPIRTDGTGLSDIFDSLIIGPTIKELTDRKFLVPSIVYAPAKKLDLSNVKMADGDYDRHELAEIVDNSVITGDAIQYYSRICPHAPAVVFCVSIAHAEHVAEQFRAAGYKARSVDGTMEDVERRRIIAGLSNGSTELAMSCDIISEGTDVPGISAAILLRPTQSTGLFLQQVGRALRPMMGKTAAYILDHVGNVLLHGMPDDDREWSLEGEKKSKKKKTDDGIGVKVKQCPNCFAMHRPAPLCPMCSHVYEKDDTDTPDEVDGDLRQVTANDEIMLKRQRVKEEKACKTYEELAALGAKRQYKPGWAKHKWEARQKIAGSFRKNAAPPHTLADQPLY
jgi:DNA repair protein RadD